jgi:hypothetical protein
VSIAEFRDSDEAFLAWLAAHPGGYVINIGRGERGSARLHRADCDTITRLPPLTGPYIKICSVSLAELGQWSAQRPGATVSSCGTCHPRAGAKTGSAPAAATGLAAGAAAMAHARAAAGTAAGGGGWEIDGRGLLGEVWLWADGYIPFDQLTPPCGTRAPRCDPRCGRWRPGQGRSWTPVTPGISPRTWTWRTWFCITSTPRPAAASPRPPAVVLVDQGLVALGPRPQ